MDSASPPPPITSHWGHSHTVTEQLRKANVLYILIDEVLLPLAIWELGVTQSTEENDALLHIIHVCAACLC